MKINVVAFVLMGSLCQSVMAQQNSESRETLTGNWEGAREKMEASGVYIDPRLTLFNQNFVAGAGSNESDFNGKAQLGITLNGVKIGLENWTMVTKAEYNFGDGLPGSGNVLIPKNTAITFPGFDNGARFDLSSLFFIYNWKDNNQLLFGKINMIDLAAGTEYSGGAGLDAFWSLGLAAPVSGITPPYLFGAIAKTSGEKLNWTLMAYDPKSVVGHSGLDKPFDSGIVLSVSPSWDVKIGHSVGEHSIRLAYSTQDGDNLYNLGDLETPVEVPQTNKENRYYASYSFNHPLQEYEDNKSWGLFGQFSVSDGNPTPVDYSVLLGVGGNSFIKNRNQDKWGIGLYLYSLSHIIDDKSAELDIPLRNETGIEGFYQAWLNPWFSLGANCQIIKPIVKDSDTAVFLGIRSSVKF